MKALSVRQPWAWLIVNGYKDIENRSWPTARRGEIIVHASAGMTPALRDLQIQLPARDIIERGGIVGRATITGCVSASTSPWFFGPQGFLLAGAQPLPFVPFKGALGFFDVPADVVKP